jgi:acetoacetate decarboxylase
MYSTDHEQLNTLVCESCEFSYQLLLDELATLASTLGYTRKNTWLHLRGYTHEDTPTLAWLHSLGYTRVGYTRLATLVRTLGYTHVVTLTRTLSYTHVATLAKTLG